MDFLPKEIEAYSDFFTDPESELLQELNRETYANILMPRMLSGHIQGRVLSMFSKMIQPRFILEIGTFTGYSALCLAEGLQEYGKLITIDINDELEKMVRRFFEKSTLHSKLDYKIGHALDIIPSLDETFDLVFIDADKDNYSNYYDLVLPKLKTGGFIIADNVLWSGKVLMPEKEMDRDTLSLHQFNQKIHADDRVENVLFPIRDGLMVIRKKP
jgi:predicted O-methyltransferase YrrM